MEFADKRLLSLFFVCSCSPRWKGKRSKFKSEKLRRLLEFPVYFLGALPSNTPALYSILNYADLVLGTWYPMGGMERSLRGCNVWPKIWACSSGSIRRQQDLTWVTIG